MKERLEPVSLENLDQDLFDYLTTFMSYKKDLILLLLLSKKMNGLVTKCPGGKLAEQLLPQSTALAESMAQEFLFNNVLRQKNSKPFAIIIACLCMLQADGNEILNPIYIFALIAAIGFTSFNIRQEYHNLGVFKDNRQKQIKEIEKPLDLPVNMF